MSKGKKRDYSLPFGVKSRIEQSKLAKKGIPPPGKPKRELGKIEISKFAKGIISEFGDYEYKPGGVYKFDGTIPNRLTPIEEGGYIPIPEGSPIPFRQEYPGGWDLERLKQLIEGFPEGKIVTQETKNPTDQWVDEWVKNNGKAHSSL